MRITDLLDRPRFKDMPMLMIFFDRAMAGDKVVDPEAFKQEYADEIAERIRNGRIWCIDVSNPQGAKPIEL